MSGERVLVVDDHPHAVRVITLALKRKGYVVESASDGFEALEMLQQVRYDVLITDIEMPRMNGRDLCDALHDRDGFEMPLTFVITGGTDPELRDWASRRERTSYIEKPLSLKQLTEQLTAHFRDGSPG